MLELTKTPHIKRVIKIIANNEEVKFPKVARQAIELLVNCLIDQSIEAAVDYSSTPEEVFGEEWTNKKKRIGNIIRGGRAKEGITQVGLAKKLGFNRSSLSAIENGERSLPKEIVTKIAIILRLDPKILR